MSPGSTHPSPGMSARKPSSFERSMPTAALPPAANKNRFFNKPKATSGIDASSTTNTTTSRASSKGGPTTKQHLIVLRVANPQVNLTDDSSLELTNRWLILVDLHQKVVITLHRVDTKSMAHLRSQWRTIMRRATDPEDPASTGISFQQFLLKLLDDAVATYQNSLDVHASVLDLCEGKLIYLAGDEDSSSRDWRRRQQSRMAAAAGEGVAAVSYTHLTLPTKRIV
eukprot:TRINITY_DN60966_c0_g2_i2.p1 TRINITY_DN60966_c0_g2~~TRINITY_DN60966_c0_g2_i2.p1  ORF type:complete len:226 (+),score=50.28 TRINITY_DN60966_c0_g2_i2:294-971(+)